MLRQIRIKKNFKQNIETPLVTGDNKAYEIVWEIGQEAAFGTLQLVATRDDLKMICDSCEIGADGIARYILKNNMYSIPGRLKLMLSVVNKECILTEKILYFNIIRGHGLMESNGEDGPPPFTDVVEDVEKMKEHLTAENPHNITKESLGLDYSEKGLRNISLKSSINKGYLLLDDINIYLSLNLLGIQGNCVQNGVPDMDNPVEIESVCNPKIRAKGKEVELNCLLHGLGEDPDGCVRDRYYATEGKAYYEKNIVIVDKLEDFNFIDGEVSPYYGQKLDENFVIYKSKLPVIACMAELQLCNRMVYTPPWSGDCDKTGFYCDEDYICVTVPKKDFPTAESFNNKIKEIYDAGETFEIYYGVYESEITEVENPQLVELLNLKEVYGVYSTSKIPIYIEAIYNRRADNVFLKIKDAIEELGGHVDI